MANKPRKPWIAGVLTLVTRGLGHLYAGSPKRGLVLFAIEQCLVIALGISTIIYTPDIYSLLVFVVIGIGFAIFCVLDAAAIARTKKDQYELAKYNRWFAYIGYFIVMSLCVNKLIEIGYVARQNQASQSLFVNLGGPESPINNYVENFKGLILLNPKMKEDYGVKPRKKTMGSNLHS